MRPSTSSVIRKIRIHTRMSYQLITTRIAKYLSISDFGEDVEQWYTSQVADECVNGNHNSGKHFGIYLVELYIYSTAQ